MVVRILTGDCRSVLPTLPDASVQCVVTSPPYFGLRDYGTASWEGGDSACDHKAAARQGATGDRVDRQSHTLDGNVDFYRDTCGKCGARRIDQQIGLEASVEDYVAEMVRVFREVRRVLRDDGTLWLNLGDSYSGSGPSGASYQSETTKRRAEMNTDGTFRISKTLGARGLTYAEKKPVPTPGLKPKDLIGIPWRVAFALQADGWYLRSDIIWSKPNPMPESVKGSHYFRHRVTIAEYENLSGLRYTGERGDQDWTGDVSSVSAREGAYGEASISAEREGQGDRTGAGTTTGRERETAAVLRVSAGSGEPCKVPPDREGSAGSQGTAAASLPDREGPRRKSEAVCHAPLTQAGSRGNGHGAGLARDPGSSQASLLLLWEADAQDDPGPCDSSEQGRAQLTGECGASLSEVQLLETRQDYSSLLVDCPGCPKCSPHGGYILSMSAGRPTKAHEYLFLLTKSPSYFYDSESIAEASVSGVAGMQGGYAPPGQAAHSRSRDGSASGKHALKQDALGIRRYAGFNARWEATEPTATRNARSVWTIATAPYKESHFATFPPDLAERCIKAGTSEKGACAACGAPWVRQASVTYENPGNRSTNGPRSLENRDITAGFAVRLEKRTETTGWQASCQCDADVSPCVVLDPFAGAGTVSLVAERLGRDSIGIELNPAYVELAAERIRRDCPMFATVEVA